MTYLTVFILGVIVGKLLFIWLARKSWNKDL